MSKMKTNSTSVTFEVASETPSPSGAFDTSARIDAGAALMRNQTWLATAKWHPTSLDYSGYAAQEGDDVSSAAG